jgi:hypothetical protein
MPNDMYADKCQPVEKFDKNDKCSGKDNLAASLWSDDNFKKLPTKVEKDLHDVDIYDNVAAKKKALAEKDNCSDDSDVILKKKLASAKELNDKADGDEVSKKKFVKDKDNFDSDDQIILKKKLAEKENYSGKNFDKSSDKDFDAYKKVDKTDSLKKVDKFDPKEYVDKFDKNLAEKALPKFDKDFADKNENLEKTTPPGKHPIEVGNETGDRLLSDLHRGSFGDRDERALLEGQFSAQAKLAGERGEQAMLDKLNNALKGDGSPYRLRFGQNHIKTPGGRRLEIVDASGHVTDHLDFVVPTRH